MTVNTLFCFFLLSLQATNSPSVDALKHLHRAAGEDVSAACGMSFSGSWKIFCRENCESGNILIQTRENKAQRERYSIEYVKEFSSDIYVFYVKISKLKPSDSGLYRCGLGDSSSAMIYQEFRLVVAEDISSQTSRPTTRQSLGSSSGSFAPSVSSGTTNQAVLTINYHDTTECQPSLCSSPQNVWFFVAPTLAIIVLLLSGTLVVFCRKRSKEVQTASPAEIEETPPETTRITEDSTEGDGLWRSANVEIYLAYVDAISSAGTAATYQHRTPDDDDDEGKISSRRSHAPGRFNKDMNDVVYSVCRPDELLYSNIF